MYNSVHFEHLTGKAKGSLHNTEARNTRKLTHSCAFAWFCMWHSFSPNNKHVTHDCITTSIDQWFKGYPVAMCGSLHYGLVCLMILLKEQHHWYLQSTSKSRLTYFTIIELGFDFLIQSIEATFIPSTRQ